MRSCSAKPSSLTTAAILAHWSMLARTMWLEHRMRVSCRRERGSISRICNKLHLESVVQVYFAASDPTTMTAARWRSQTDNVSLVFARSRSISISGLRPLGLRFSACRLFRTRNQETATSGDACSINQMIRHKS
jgi:hypothetical protein